MARPAMTLLKETEFRNGESILIKSKIYDVEGKKALDIRKYYLTNEGNWLPTKKGIFMPLEDVDNGAIEILEGTLEFVKEFKDENKS